MATITVYEEDSQANVIFTVNLIKEIASGSTPEDIYIQIICNSPIPNGGGLIDNVEIRTIDDVPPGYAGTSSFEDIIPAWVEHMLGQLKFVESSSSSSTEEMTSSSSSSVDSSSSSS